MSPATKTDAEQPGSTALLAGNSLIQEQPACDPMLRPLVEESDERRREQIIETLLVGHLGRIIMRTLQGKLRRLPVNRALAACVDDVRSTAFLRLLKRLRQVTPDSAPIQNLAGYTATIALNAWDDCLREAFPQRTLLKNRIRYVLLRNDRFAMWTAREQIVCGLAPWTGRNAGAADAIDVGDVSSRCGSTAPLADILEALFQIAKAPVELEAVVSAVAEISGILDEPDNVSAWAGLVESSDAPVAAHEAEDRQILMRLWKEIVALSHPQRVAFLLNLRDAAGDAATPLFVTTGVATIEGIAEELGMCAHDFAALWNDLPIADNVIARILGVTRQQVINLRSAARKRLARRMSRF